MINLLRFAIQAFVLGALLYVYVSLVFYTLHNRAHRPSPDYTFKDELMELTKRNPRDTSKDQVDAIIQSLDRIKRPFSDAEQIEKITRTDRPPNDSLLKVSWEDQPVLDLTEEGD